MAGLASTDVAIARVLSHPTRPRILELLARRGEASPNEIAAELSEPLGAISYHVRLLRDQGWVELVRTAQRRGAVEHFYRATERPLVDDAEWERLPRAVRRRLAAHTVGEILASASNAVTAGGFDRAGSHVDRLSLELDAEGWTELSQLLLKTLDEAARIQQRSSERGEPARARSQLAILHHTVADDPSADPIEARPAPGARS